MKTKNWIVGIAMSIVAAGANAEVRSDLFVNPNGGVDGGSTLDCTDLDTYQQPLDTANFNTARTSDVQPVQQVWEDFVDGAGTITPLPAGTLLGDLRVWGLSLEFDPGLGFVAECLTDHTANTPYNITIWDDNAGSPGNLLGSTTATPTAITNTGVPFAFTSIFEYDLNLDTPLDMTNAAWISAERQTGQQAGSGNDCYWLWVDEDLGGTYDDAAVSLANGPEPTDQTFCAAAAVVQGGPPIIEVPTLDKAALAGLALLLLAAGVVAVRRFN